MTNFLKKSTLAALFAVTFLASVHAQFTFKACEVKPATEPLERIAYSKSVAQLTNTGKDQWKNTGKEPNRTLAGYGQGPDFFWV